MKHRWHIILLICICSITLNGISGCKSKRQANPGKEPRHAFISKMRQGSFRINSVASGKQILTVQGRQQVQNVFGEIKSTFHFPTNTDSAANNGIYSIQQVQANVGGFIIDSNEDLPEPEKSKRSMPYSPSPPRFDSGDATQNNMKASILAITKKICEGPFEFNVLEDNNVSITNKPDYSELLDTASPEIKLHMQTLVDSWSTKVIEEYINVANNILPDTEVGLGAIWYKSLPLKSLVSDQFTENVIGDFEYELVSISGPKAIINMSCKKKDNTVRKVVFNRMNVDINQLILNLTGTITYNLNDGVIEKIETDNKVSIKFSIPGQGSFKSDISLKTTMTTDKI